MNSIPVAPGTLPWLGALPSLLRDPFGFLASLPHYGNLVRIRIGPVTAVVVCDPGLLQQVLRHDRVIDKGGLFYDKAREVAGDGLVTCPHNKHRRQRRLVQPAFHTARLPGYARAMTEQIEEVIGQWRDGDVLDVLGDLQTITSRTTAATLLSKTVPPPVLHQAIADVTTVMTRILPRMLLPASLGRLPTPGNRHYHRANRRLRRTLSQIITERRANGAEHDDLLAALLAARDDDTADDGTNLHLSDTEIADQIVSFFIGGTETTASVLSWALHLLAQHPEVERRLHVEVDRVLAGAPARFDHLPQLSLASRIVTETLRLYPPAWMLTRIVTEDTILGEHHLPSGTTLVYSPYLVHRRSDLYPDPDHFNPDRWDSTHRSPPPREAFVPFGGGARKCIGEDFGRTEVTLALAAITARWRLQSLPGQHVRPALAAPLQPRRLHMRTLARTPHPQQWPYQRG